MVEFNKYGNKHKKEAEKVTAKDLLDTINKMTLL